MGLLNERLVLIQVNYPPEKLLNNIREHVLSNELEPVTLVLSEHFILNLSHACRASTYTSKYIGETGA